MGNFRKAVAISFALLSGCQKPEVKVCEDYILSKLLSPSTYKQVEVEGMALPSERSPKYNLFVTYDAANAYGTPVRARQLCVFALKNGKPDLDRNYNFDEDFSGAGTTPSDAYNAAQRASDEADNAMNAALEAADRAAAARK